MHRFFRRRLIPIRFYSENKADDIPNIIDIVGHSPEYKAKNPYFTEDDLLNFWKIRGVSKEMIYMMKRIYNGVNIRF
jgi:hypothetical protein